LAGADALKKNPDVIRKGQEKASIKVDLGDFVVSRRFTKTDTYLDVYTKDGAKYPSPQAVLDKLINMVAFDPLAFANLPKDKQVETLLKFSEISIDLPATDKKIKEAYEERPAANKVMQKAKSVLESTPEPAGERPLIESVDDLIKERKAITDEVGVLQTKQHKFVERGSGLRGEIGSLTQQIEDTEKLLAQMRGDLVKLTAELDKDVTVGYKAVTKEIADGEYEKKLSDIDERIKAFEKVSSTLKAFDRYEDAKKTAIDAVAEYEKLDGKLIELRNDKKKAILEAKFPIDGLGLDDENGVTFNEIPFVQCSSAERLKVGIAMVIAMNPNIRVIRITDGSLLDSESMGMIEEMCKEYNLQAWIEKVDESGKIGIVIEDGEVKKDNYDSPGKSE